MTKDKSLIQSCVDHINTAIDVDPWAKELVIEMGKEVLEQLKKSNQELKNQNDLISRQAAIDEIDEWIKAFRENGHKESAADACLIQDGIIQLPSAQPQPEEDCDTCKHGYFGDRQCDNCRVRYPSHYEREEEQHEG